MAQITDSHLRAELACCEGHSGLLAKYFRAEWPPSPDVLKSLSRHLEGSDNWNFRFVVRNGRPPMARSVELWEEGQEGIISRRLYLLGEGIANNSMSRSEIRSAQEFLFELANVLDPKGTSKWKLVFSHPQKGNPTPPLHHEIRRVILGLTAIKINSGLKSWKATDAKLYELGLAGADNSARKKAVRFVKERLK